MNANSFPSTFWATELELFWINVLKKAYKERALIGTYLKLAHKTNENVCILSNQKKNANYKWNPISNHLLLLPENKSKLYETIAWYQTADYLYLNNKLK